VGTIVELVIAILLPTVAGYFLVASLRGARWSFERWHIRQYRLHVQPEPIERIGSRLRRLRTELDAVETHTGLTAKNARLKALRGAYVDVLTLACERLDVTPPPGSERAPQAEIYRVEAALRQRGLDVREPAVR
jgi:hypothetical protein